jgi:Transposase DDE domain/Domain of unknown function (DUF4372)
LFQESCLMNTGQTVFAQLLKFVPFNHFEYLTQKYKSNHRTQNFTAWSHFICMSYAQFTRREGLRDLALCLNSQRSRLYHAGMRHVVSRSTLADANERRSFELFESLAKRLTEMALDALKDTPIPLDLKEPLYALDSTTIDLCLSLFAWADFRQTKAAVKAHTVIDLRGAIPVFVSITTGKVHDVQILDSLQMPAGSILVMDRGYVDYKRLYQMVKRECSFVVRAKDNMRYTVCSAQTDDLGDGVRGDEVIELTLDKAKRAYPKLLRRVHFYDQQSKLDLVFLTNRFDLKAVTIAAIYKQRWQIELFFKWLKQNLSIGHFFGNSLNAVKSQIWIAICTYLIALLAHQSISTKITLRNFMHLIEVNMFEKISLAQMVKDGQQSNLVTSQDQQENLF